jgi:hypothetical protein
MKILFPFHCRFHGEPIELFIALEPGGLNCRPFRGVEQTEMYGRLVGDLPHLSAQRIDFFYQLAFGKASDSWVTGHEGDGIEVDIEHDRGASHPGRRQCCFAAGMARADDYHIVIS